MSCAVSVTVDQAPGQARTCPRHCGECVTQAGSQPLRLSVVKQKSLWDAVTTSRGALQQAAALSPLWPWLPDLLIDSDGQGCQSSLPLGGGAMLWADSVFADRGSNPHCCGDSEVAEAEPLSPRCSASTPLQPSTPSMLSCGSLFCVSSRLVAGVNLATSCRPSETQ